MTLCLPWCDITLIWLSSYSAPPPPPALPSCTFRLWFCTDAFHRVIEFPLINDKRCVRYGFENSVMDGTILYINNYDDFTLSPSINALFAYKFVLLHSPAIGSCNTNGNRHHSSKCCIINYSGIQVSEIENEGGNENGRNALCTAFFLILPVYI